jgi:protein-tyrosine phosphatase/nicotinamidase-related amidase
LFHSILITQCLQRDFIDPVEAHEPLPNKLHVGREESQRLMGRDPLTGPIAQILNWARRQPSDKLDIIHIRDWHDCDDLEQEDHLAMFGDHCIADTHGAALVLGFDKDAENRPNEHFINSTALNDFEDTELTDLLCRIAEKEEGKPLRIGVIGVWTEAKVSFLLYDLKTRCHINDLATCSALTASNSRAQHFNALEQLRKILGVEVFDSTGEFVEWLVPDSTIQSHEPDGTDFEARLILSDPEMKLEMQDREILGFLYSDSSEVALDPLSGGYSGALVFQANSRDAIGHEHAPSVAKIGPRSEIGTERAAFERIEQVLGNNAPRIMKFVDFSERAGIKYSYAAMGRGKIRTFKSIYQSGAAQDEVDGILNEVFGVIFEPFYAAATYERLPLLDYYTFTPDYAERARKKVAAFFPDSAKEPRLTLPDGSEAMNVADFYSGYVADNVGKFGDFHYVSYVHGDLNAANILVDARDNIWIIDFFHTSRGHILRDLLKLENDLLYILTPVTNEEDLREAMLITHALTDIRDLRHEFPAQPKGLKSEQFLRAWATIRTLRKIGAELCREDRNPRQALIGMLRYSMHTQSFFESNELQKKWALAASCLYAERIVASAERNLELRIDWINSDVLRTDGRLGMTLCPGRVDHDRSLNEDLKVLKNSNVSRLYGLLTERELEWAGVPSISQVAEKFGIEYSLAPIPDQGTLSFEETSKLTAEIIEALELGEDVVLHCVGGLGRTGMMAACVAVDRGVDAGKAIELVRKMRSPRSIESGVQEKFVRSYGESRR